ncbi:hypothetical protein GQ44DRAFT_711283 [Phaeosphaeriaceae sp. PMI808]|nr:hypothetical protein GQ44DRAFT_711283 [Phaeosphaeriaceae sp. PMI808]
MPKSTPTPGVPNKPYCNGYDCKPDVYITTKVYHTRVITLSTIPVREGPKSISYNGCTGYGCQPEAPVSMPNTPVQGTPIIRPSVPATPIVSKPAVPTAYKPNGPVYGNNGNGTNVVGTGVRATPSKTGYTPPVFTGAASSIQAGSVVAVVGVVAGFFL